MSFDKPRHLNEGYAITKAEHDALMARRNRPLTDRHMVLHRDRTGDQFTPDEALTVFGVAIPMEGTP